MFAIVKRSFRHCLYEIKQNSVTSINDAVCGLLTNKFSSSNYLQFRFRFPCQASRYSTLVYKKMSSGSGEKDMGKGISKNISAVTGGQKKGLSDDRVTRSDVEKQEQSWKEKYLAMSIEEKRNVYKCGSKYTELESVKTWPDYAAEIHQKYTRPYVEPKCEFNDALNRKISLWRGDITTLEIDVIVNAANNSLLGGGGVDGAIHRAAGAKLREECAKLNGCPTGEAKITGGYKLPAKYIIHTVGPIGVNPQKLASCYKECLKLMKENKLRVVAFPCISTGIYGYDVEKATPVVMKTVRDWMEKDNNMEKVDRVIFCVFLKNDVEVYEDNLLQYFPPGPHSGGGGEKKDKKDRKKPKSESAVEDKKASFDSPKRNKKSDEKDVSEVKSSVQTRSSKKKTESEITEETNHTNNNSNKKVNGVEAEDKETTKQEMKVDQDENLKDNKTDKKVEEKHTEDGEIKMELTEKTENSEGDKEEDMSPAAKKKPPVDGVWKEEEKNVDKGKTKEQKNKKVEKVSVL